MFILNSKINTEHYTIYMRGAIIKFKSNPPCGYSLVPPREEATPEMVILPQIPQCQC